MVHRHFTAYANGPAVPGRGQLPARPRKVLHAGPFEAEGLLVHFPPTSVGNPHPNVLQQVCLYIYNLILYSFKCYLIVRINVSLISGLM